MNLKEEKIIFTSMPDWEEKIYRKLETLFAEGLDRAALHRFEDLISRAVFILLPFLTAFEGGWCGIRIQANILRVGLHTPLIFPAPSLRLPKTASQNEDGVLTAICRCLYETAALGNTPGYTPTLSDGLMHFGILRGTGYYWSLSDHRNRLKYEKHPKSFDEISNAVPTADEKALENIKLVYDNHELELTLCLKLTQEEQ